MNPAYRGRGLSAGYMAAVAVAARSLAPTVSLYVNSYNARAIASYRRVGFTQVGTFATVLL
jgi:predicted GNAT family acetyltransferase